MSATPAPRLRKGFVNCAHGQMHYRVAGFGPPVVLLHDSPRSSAMFAELLAYLGEEFTAIALDLPGYGNSAPLPIPQPEIADFARAVVDALTALGLERCPLYGFHAGAKVLLDVATSHPERVSLAILEGLALPLGPPDREFMARDMRPFELSEDGSYLAREWTRVRDAHRFFPWFARTERSRLLADLPDERELHDYAVDVFSAGANYGTAYAAAMRYAAQAVVGRSSVPTVIMCREDDFLYRYLDALPENLPSHVRVERLGAGRDQAHERVRAHLREASDSAAGSIALPDPLLAPAVRGEVRGYVTLPNGQVHVRRIGNGARRPVLLLHETPGSSAQLRPLLRELGKDRPALAIDLPGLGDSSPLTNPDAAGHRDMLLGVLDALGVASADVVAEFTAVPLALEFARSASNRVHRLVLDGVFQLAASERRSAWKSYCPVVRPTWDGAYLLALWHRLRDQELSWPWYERSRAGVRRRDPDIGAERLHAMLLDVMKQLDHYGEACLAALEYPVKEALDEVSQGVLLPHAAEDVRYQWTRKAVRRLPEAETVARASDVAERARQYGAFLDR
jgi:pimeloyl-ACP methyl ester carboxylesterase